MTRQPGGCKCSPPDRVPQENQELYFIHYALSIGAPRAALAVGSPLCCHRMAAYLESIVFYTLSIVLSP